MEKRILGIILSLLDIIKLIYAGAAFMNGNSNARNIKMIVIFAMLGDIFFWQAPALWVIPSTKKPRKKSSMHSIYSE